MILDEQFDADEILRDVDERYVDDDLEEEEDMRELNFGTIHDENANFSDMASDLDTADDLWEYISPNLMLYTFLFENSGWTLCVRPFLFLKNCYSYR